MNHRLIAIVLCLGALSLASLTGMAVLMIRLDSVADQLREMEQLHMGERLRHLELQQFPRVLPLPKTKLQAVTD